jgi:hypothetical protein
MISRLPGSPVQPISRKPVTAVNAMTAQVTGPVRVTGERSRPVTRTPKTGYTGTPARRWAAKRHCCRCAPDLRVRSRVARIPAVTGFWDMGAPGRPGDAKRAPFGLGEDPAS